MRFKLYIYINVYKSERYRFWLWSNTVTVNETHINRRGPGSDLQQQTRRATQSVRAALLE